MTVSVMCVANEYEASARRAVTFPMQLLYVDKVDRFFYVVIPGCLQKNYTSFISLTFFWCCRKLITFENLFSIISLYLADTWDMDV